MLERLSDHEAMALFEGKTVALVGNDKAMMKAELGEQIDSHDVVVRMNRGVPNPGLEKRVGSKTDIVTAGKIHPLDTFTLEPAHIFWLKHTSLGAMHLADVDKWQPFKKAGVRLWHMPRVTFDSFQMELVSAPSAGYIMARLLTQFANPKKISVFGITCWGKLEAGSQFNTWWPHARIFHNPDAEAAAFRAMGVQRIGRLHFELGREHADT